MSRTASRNQDPASHLQRAILGPGRIVIPCGCTLDINGYFPKKPWVHVCAPVSACNGGSPNEAHVVYGWIDKNTGKLVPKDEFLEAWLSMKKTDGRSDLSERTERVVRVSPYLGTRANGVLVSLFIGSGPVPKRTAEWPPKMGELFRKIDGRD